MTAQDQARAVGRLLETLLLGEYADLWQRSQGRARAGTLNQAAIAKVIADHLWATWLWDDTDESLRPRRLRDRIHRALRGEGITPETLEWFIDAFSMDNPHARSLRAALNTRPASAAVPLANTLRPPQDVPIRQLHKTRAVFERLVIGPNGVPVSHHATRAIIAHAGPVSFYPCRQFPADSEVTMLCGATITGRHEFPGSTPILEMRLSTPLPVGEVGSLEYQANFAPGSGVSTEYRQVAHARASNVNIVVQFHRKRLPRRVWWAAWNEHRDGTLLWEQPVSLDSEGRAHHYLPYLENAAGGFRWEWQLLNAHVTGARSWLESGWRLRQMCDIADVTYCSIAANRSRPGREKAGR